MKSFDVIIIGGSYAGLSAAMALGRSIRNVLIIDAGQPCNHQTPHSHNFITQDGQTPATIALHAKNQVLKYETVIFENGEVIGIKESQNSFKVTTEKGRTFSTRKILFATGLTDIMPPIAGFRECWGISVLHCPYCHGYEVRNEKLGVLANGEIGFEFGKLISHWTKDMTLFTNGKSTLTPDQMSRLSAHNISVVEKAILRFDHENGQIKTIVFDDGSMSTIDALFAKIPNAQRSPLPASLGCTINAQGLIEVNEFQMTTVPGIYAAGDCASMRALSVAVASGTKAGAFINFALINESFQTG